VNDKFLRVRAVVEITGLARSTIYALAKASRFPSPFKLGARSSAWSQREVAAWMESKKQGASA
jgi:prophage regulatory protein